MAMLRAQSASAFSKAPIRVYKRARSMMAGRSPGLARIASLSFSTRRASCGMPRAVQTSAEAPSITAALASVGSIRRDLRAERWLVCAQHVPVVRHAAEEVHESHLLDALASGRHDARAANANGEALGVRNGNVNAAAIQEGYPAAAGLLNSGSALPAGCPGAW
jgi:hypothetical protein